MEATLNQTAIHQWILDTFYKEGVLLFLLICLLFFVAATVFAKWGLENGEFANLEESKFEMLDL